MHYFKNLTSLLVVLLLLTGCKNDNSVTIDIAIPENDIVETREGTDTNTPEETPDIITTNSASTTTESPTITDYRVTLDRGIVAGRSVVILRSFERNGVATALIVDDTTYETALVTQAEISDYTASIDGSQYQRVLQQFSQGTAVSNEGLRRAASAQKDTLYLSADLCPSTKTGFEQDFFEQFIADGHRKVAIALSVDWVHEHQAEFDWLLARQAAGELDITWVNHSEHHHYDPSLPLHKNFMLMDDTDLAAEVLSTEQLLLRHGQVPSVFFRFPGLVADKALRTELAEEYGLVPLGSDAWLAKDETPQDGSIILIHGNRNEPKGIEMAEDLLHELRENQEKPFESLHKALEGAV